jgi:hypothetical protein
VLLPLIHCLTRRSSLADDPESVIITAARRLDARNFPLSQLGIQFVQIGNDPSASEALAELDDGLAAAHGVRVSLKFHLPRVEPFLARYLGYCGHNTVQRERLSTHC